MCEPISAAIIAGTVLGGGSILAGALKGGPDLPSYPGLSPDEVKLIEGQGLTIEKLDEITSGGFEAVKANRQILQGVSGLFDESGEVNQEALKGLQGRIKGQIEQQNVIGEKGLDYLGGFFDTQLGPMANEITKAAQERYLKALRGDIPVTQATQDEASRQFAILKEAAGQRGIRIEGDSWDSATSESTAGIRLIGEFKRNYNLKVEGERQAELQTGAQTLGTLTNIGASNLATVGSIGQIAAGTRPAELGVLGSLETQGASLTPQLQVLSGLRQNLLGFMQGERLGQHAQATQQELLDYQHTQNLLNQVGYLGGQLTGYGLLSKFSPQGAS